MNNNSGNQGLDVYLWDHLAGHLRLDEKRRFVFQYDAEWIKKKNAIPLSVHLPLSADIYPDDLSRPFFSNLLPEAEVKRIIARHLQISASNDFAMLNSIGGECAGAVSVLPAGFVPVVKPGYRGLNDEELNQVIQDHPKSPLMAGLEGMRLHQEDFCQALEFLPDQKYESEGGPSLGHCFTLLQGKSISPAADRLALLRWTIFNPPELLPFGMSS